MGKYTLQQIAAIIDKRPNKKRVEYAQALNKKLMLHVHGEGMKNALAQLIYFENTAIYKARRDYAISNVDLFERLLSEENQVFTTRGGSAYFNLPEGEEKQMNELLADVVYGVSLSEWVERFGLQAYRCDPMGVIFMEVEKVTTIEGDDNEAAGKPTEYNIETPKCYPTYKCSQDIWEYQCNGRSLDYICFALTEDELVAYGIKEQSNWAYPLPQAVEVNKQYFRWVDAGMDVIVKKEINTGLQIGDAKGKANPVVTIVPLDGVQNPIIGLWDKVPGFIASDLMRFQDAGTFNTPLYKVVELADSFLFDRSQNTLTKKYHGFPKAFEPVSTCVTCGGEGYIKGVSCPDCTIPGHTKGSGYKLQTTIGDVFKIPMDIMNADKAPRFNIRNIYGYVTPDIDGVEMQVSGLKQLEEMMFITYWSKNNNQISGFNGKQDSDETATKTITDLQGKYARLNLVADWKDKTERAIADLIGNFWFGDIWKGANISSGRNYILENTDTLLDCYYAMRKNGVPDSMLDNQYEKYIACLWRANPVQALIYQNKFDVEPFPHLSATEVETSNVILEIDKICKRYFGEWDDTITDVQWAFMKPDALRKSMNDYANKKKTLLLEDKQAVIADTIALKGDVAE